MKSTFKHRIALMLLILFASIKLTGLHELTHSDTDHDTCVVCDIAVAVNVIPFLPVDGDVFRLEVQQFPNKTQNVETYTFVFVKNNIPNFLFSRPPPTV
ncbi:hypothetical protein PK35_00800 [Tamlana nanhaiensis]|uniref:Uncharacterized protein n=1 Tax=Neotamlana nanhaiensis TaxID=1382798 RepID=A0A0D7W9B2_9FLAO|nr:hypothetical protein [Tamlana nanhaiensis]KJD34377.1 hypothetical protein PK35_00800 [Tamlana nanhaiensis]